jgi:uncharacterized OB-fold protein
MVGTLPTAASVAPVTTTRTSVPAIEGWFADGPDGAHLLGNRCTTCSTYVFPPRATYCPSPTCTSDTFELVPLSQTGTVWSYTDNQYQPPPPYVPTSDPFTPFAVVAVSLEKEGMVVMGQAAAGVTIEDLRVGMPVRLVIEILFADDDHEHLVWKWAPA